MVLKDNSKYKYKKSYQDWTDTVPPTLVKLAPNFLAPYLLNAVNISIRQSTFPENTKVTPVSGVI